MSDITTWKQLEQHELIDEIRIDGPEVHGHNYNRYMIWLKDGVDNPVTGEIGGGFYAEDLKDALSNLGITTARTTK